MLQVNNKHPIVLPTEIMDDVMPLLSRTCLENVASSCSHGQQLAKEIMSRRLDIGFNSRELGRVKHWLRRSDDRHQHRVMGFALCGCSEHKPLHENQIIDLFSLAQKACAGVKSVVTDSSDAARDDEFAPQLELVSFVLQEGKYMY